MSRSTPAECDSESGRAATFGRFRPLARVGSGVLGETWMGYAAQGRDAGRSVLLTLCEHSPDSMVMMPLLKAAQRAQRLRHPQALAFLDAVSAPGQVVFVHEYLEGERLSGLMNTATSRSTPIAPSVALSIAKQSIEGLASLRAERSTTVAHGALRPETIFVAQFGEVLLQSPDIASAAMSVTGFRQHSSSLPYLAPEYLLDPRENEESADVFSLGVILWEMLAGASLFGSTMAEPAERTRQRVISMPIPSIGSVQRPGGALHPDIVRLTDWALQREPGLRPQTLSDFSRALASLSPTSIASETEVGRTVHRLAGQSIALRQKRLATACGSAGRRSPMGEAARSEAVLDFDAHLAKTQTPAHQRERDLTPSIVAGDTHEPRGESHPPAVVTGRGLEKPGSARDGWLLAALALFAAGGISTFLLLQDRGSQAAASGGDQQNQAEITPPSDEIQPSAREAVPSEPTSTAPAKERRGQDEGPAKVNRAATPTRTAPSKAPRPQSADAPAPSKTKSGRAAGVGSGAGADGAYRPDGI